MAMRFAGVLEAYRDRRMLIVLGMGFSSGLPLALTGTTLAFWLSSVGVQKTEIGLFHLTGLAYLLKFLWSPLFDHWAAPWLGRRLGRRRAWGIVTQIGLIASLIGVGSADPRAAPLVIAVFAVLVAFFSASQDIVIDAYRVEILDRDQQPTGAAVTQYGYRLGMLMSGAGALYLSEILSWFWVYAVMAGCIGLGLVVFLVSPEPAVAAPKHAPRLGLARTVRETVLDPLADFAKHAGWPVILGFVVLFKFGDALVGSMTMPFYREMGFTAGEIASVTKVAGLAATIAGIFAGGVLATKLPLLRALLICGILQIASNAMFAVQATMGNHVVFLTLTVVTENFFTGMGSAAFMAYLAALCSLQYTATHYALLSALAAFGRVVLSSGGGWIADQMDWVAFFLTGCAAGTPGLVLLVYLMWTGRSAAVAHRAPAGAPGG
jgi:PAT family beta-lactamase induction signal transducer AmpG